MIIFFSFGLPCLTSGHPRPQGWVPKGLPIIFLEHSLGNAADPVNRLGFSSTATLRLTVNLLEEGYHVYVDNWYTSEPLFLYLSEHNRTACGITCTRKIWPKLPATFTRFSQGGSEGMKTFSLIVSLTKEICFFSRIHTANVINTRKRDRRGNNSRKLQLVDHYDKCMGVLT